MSLFECAIIVVEELAMEGVGAGKVVQAQLTTVGFICCRGNEMFHK